MYYLSAKPESILTSFRPAIRDSIQLETIQYALAPRADAWAQLLQIAAAQSSFYSQALLVLSMDVDDCRRMRIAYKNRFRTQFEVKLPPNMQNSFTGRILSNFTIRDQQIKFNKNAMQIA